jgi:glycopeptide antibiotics resistance protein
MCYREKMSMWKKVLNMLAAFIPLGLFLAALPPNILTINTTQ